MIAHLVRFSMHRSLHFHSLLSGLILAGFCAGLSASANPLKLFSQGADRVQEKRYEKTFWNRSERTHLTSKRFAIEEWGKHYSPLGSKRAPISISEQKDKQIFRSEILERKTFSSGLELSRWNERMSDLHKQAGIQMSDEAHLSANQNLYNLTLKENRKYDELAEELSLRDINRFQFRRNHSSGQVPVAKVGMGQ